MVRRAQPRRGILGFQRQTVDELHASVKVARGWVQVERDLAEQGATKTTAGRRTVNVPPNGMPVLLDHLEQFTGPSRAAWLFAAKDGDLVSPRTLDRARDESRRAVGCPISTFTTYATAA